jgi:hypothetical protein
MQERVSEDTGVLLWTAKTTALKATLNKKHRNKRNKTESIL